MGVDYIGRLLFAVDAEQKHAGRSFLDRVLAGEFGDYDWSDHETPVAGLEEFFVMQDRPFSVLAEADAMNGDHRRTWVGVELSMVANRDDHLHGGWTEGEVMDAVREAQRLLVQHGIRGAGLRLVPSIN